MYIFSVDEEKDSVPEEVATNLQKECHTQESNVAPCATISQNSPVQEEVTDHQIPDKGQALDNQVSFTDKHGFDNERTQTASPVGQIAEHGDNKISESLSHLNKKTQDENHERVNEGNVERNNSDAVDDQTQQVSQPGEDSPSVTVTRRTPGSGGSPKPHIPSVDLSPPSQLPQEHPTPTLTPDPTQTAEADAQPKPSIGQLVSVREIYCVILAVVMRWMLMCDWFTDYTGQVRICMVIEK